MTNWPVAGGTVRDVPTERGLRDIRKRGGEVERLLNETIKKGLPASGKAGGVLKGEYPNPEFAKEPAYKPELENETTARKEVDAILKGEGEAEKASREAAVKVEKEAREAADALEKSKREEADNERVKGPASATTEDIATYNGATGKVVKDSGKTIASVLLEAEETAKALASAAAAGLSIKTPVAYATTAALSAKVVTEKTIESTSKLEVDGKLGFTEGTRLLLKNQALPAQNGIWTVTEDRSVGGSGKVGGEGKVGEGSGYLLTRAVDADSTEEVKQGMFVLVTNGTANKATSWLLTSADPITIGTTAQEYSAFTAAPTGLAGGDLEGTYPEPQIKAGVIVNADVNASAAIAYSKLNLANSVKGSDIVAETIEESDLAPKSVGPSKINVNWGTWYGYPNLGNNAEFLVTENRVYFAQIQVLSNVTLTGIAYFNLLKSGNVRCALYNSAGTRVANCSTNVEALANWQKVPFTATYAATPGVYFAALVFSSALTKVAATIPTVPCGFVAGPGAGATATSITPPTEAGQTTPTMTTY